MELFTKFVETKSLRVIIEHQLKVPFQEIEMVVFKDIPDMNWIKFKYKNLNLEVYHHAHAERFGFHGSLISFGQKGFQGNENDVLVLEEVLRIFANTLGGLMTLHGGGDIETFESTPMTNALFMAEQLILKGFKEEEVQDALEELELKKDLSRKSNC